MPTDRCFASHNAYPLVLLVMIIVQTCKETDNWSDSTRELNARRHLSRHDRDDEARHYDEGQTSDNERRHPHPCTLRTYERIIVRVMLFGCGWLAVSYSRVVSLRGEGLIVVAERVHKRAPWDTAGVCDLLLVVGHRLEVK